MYILSTGGYDLKARERCLETVCKDPDIQGYLIDGLHNNGPEIEFLPFLELKPIIELIMKTIPESKLTCIQVLNSFILVYHLKFTF